MQPQYYQYTPSVPGMPTEKTYWSPGVPRPRDVPQLPMRNRRLMRPPTVNSGKATLVLVIVSSFVTGSILIGSLFAPNVFTTVVNFFTAFVRIDFDLWRVYSSSNCKALFGLLTIKKLVPICEAFSNLFDNKTYNVMVSQACAVNAVLGGLGLDACDSAVRLAWTITFLKYMYCLAAVMQTLSIVAVVAFMHVNRSSTMRMAVIVAQAASALFAMMGFFWFTLNQGFSIDLTIIPFIVSDVTPFDIGPGYMILAVALFATMLSLASGIIFVRRWMTDEGQLLEYERIQNDITYDNLKHDFKTAFQEYQRLT